MKTIILNQRKERDELMSRPLLCECWMMSILVMNIFC